MEQKTILFVCTSNSCRSPMAEAIVNHFYGDKYFAESAGLEALPLSPHAVTALSEFGIDIAGRKPADVFDFFTTGKTYNYVINVCDEENSEKCPIFRGAIETLHWSFTDPAAVNGSDEEKLRITLRVRDEMKKKIDEWVTGSD